MRLTLARISLLLFAVWLTGCQHNASYLQDARYQSVPVGTVLVLEHSIIIPKEKVAVTIFFGQVAAVTGIAGYQPSCELELWQYNQEDVEVFPDRFTVIAVSQGVTPILAKHHPQTLTPEQHLMQRINLGHKMSYSDSSSYLRAYLQMDLNSPNQPGVYRLTCSQIDDPADLLPINLTMMRQTLMGVFRVELPEEQTIPAATRI